jgi:ABC-type Zn uptake system ZnuABC Zn-binding protein ZnuA
LLETIERFLGRLDIYTKITPTAAMTEMIVKIMVEVLSTLAVATKHVKQKRSSESDLVGNPVNLNAAQ